MELLGRSDTFSAVVEPKRDSALIGAIVLEALDLLADCRRQRLVPRDPRGLIFEIDEATLEGRWPYLVGGSRVVQ